jgi:hypothetical protein
MGRRRWTEHRGEVFDVIPPSPDLSALSLEIDGEPERRGCVTPYSLIEVKADKVLGDSEDDSEPLSSLC